MSTVIMLLLLLLLMMMIDDYYSLSHSIYGPQVSGIIENYHSVPLRVLVVTVNNDARERTFLRRKKPLFPTMR